ncbi:hypothetical protein BG000_002098, partial [Podila horticola]
DWVAYQVVKSLRIPVDLFFRTKYIHRVVALETVAAVTAHRVVGYLEEQAVVSYTHMLDEIATGVLENGPAPKIAIDYWNLEETATIRDVCLAIRLDESVHMHTNHHLSDRIALKHEDLRQDIQKLQEERGMVPSQNAEEVWSKPNKY